MVRGPCATAIDYLSLLRERDQQRPPAVLVMSRAGNIKVLSAEAQRILESLPEKEAQVLPGRTDAFRIWRCGSEVVVVSTRRVDPASIIVLGYANRVPPTSSVDRLARRLRVAEGEQRREFAVTFEKLDVNNEVRGDIFGLHLSPQRKRVAILLLKRYEPRQIGEILPLSPHTVREYVKEIYRRAGVNGYQKLVSKLSNGHGASPLASHPTA